MKLKFFALTLSLSLLAQITPASGNDLKTFPCGDGATYSVSMPDGVALEGNQCSGTLTIDSSVRIIGSFAFKGSRLTSVIIPDSVFEIGWQAFWSIHLETVRLGSSVLHIGNSAFKNTKISRIEFPSKLLSIGDEAFASTTYLGWGGTKIIVPDSVRAIGDKAFSSSRIELISIPDKLIFLGKDVFVATNLRSVDYCGNLEGFHASTNLYARPIEIVKPNCSPERKLQAAAFSSLEMEAILAAEFLNAISSFSDVSKEQLREARRAAELKIKQKENATAELEAKQEAEAKARAAAELKAKQEAEAKAAAELKAKQEAEEKAEAKAAADKVICDANRAQLLSVQASLQAAIKSYPKSASALNDTRLRLQTALSSNCIADVTLNDFRSEVNSVIAEAKKSSVAKQTSITCVKGAIVKKVMAVNPKCPRGYKKK